MRIEIIVAATAMLTIGSIRTEEFVQIGSFHNVRSSTGEHCYGYSLELWRHNGRIVGLFDHHQGLCGDPPCEALHDVSYDRGTGHLSFSALDEKFTGTLRREDVIGTIGATRVRLARGHDVMAAKSFADWCEFWRGVHRCRGVDEVCASVRH
jgi:hypothetical protein